MKQFEYLKKFRSTQFRYGFIGNQPELERRVINSYKYIPSQGRLRYYQRKMQGLPGSENKIKWVKESGGTVPHNSFIGGEQQSGEKLYIARAEFEGGVHIGKVRPEFGGCNLPWGGGEHVVRDYEVLSTFGGDWVKDYAGHLPERAIKGGHESDGSPLYIGRVHFKGGVHVGKIRPELKGCYFSYGGSELCMAEYDVLVPGRFWIDADSGYIPQNSLICGYDGEEKIYVARAKFKGDIVLGKGSKIGCHIPYGGKQVLMSEYQVLKNIPGEWVWAENGDIPKGALHGGRESDGQALYIARVQFHNGKHSGKIREGFKGAHVSWGGQEHEFKKYEVFVADNLIDPEF